MMINKVKSTRLKRILCVKSGVLWRVPQLTPPISVKKSDMLHGLLADYSPRYYFCYEGKIYTRERLGSGVKNKFVDILRRDYPRWHEI